MEPRVVGLMRPFDHPHVDLTVEALGNLCDALYFYADTDASEKALAICRAHPKTAEVVIAEGKWSQAGSLERAFALLKKVKPDYIFYPDDDEILPDEREEMVKTMACGERPMALGFAMVYPFGDLEHVALGCLGNHHAKALRWTPDLTFYSAKGVYPGLCLPATHRCTYWPRPLRHLRLMTPEAIAVRPGHRQRGTHANPPPVDWKPKGVVPWDKERSTREWVRLLRS